MPYAPKPYIPSDPAMSSIVSRVRRTSAKEPGAPTLLEKSGIPGTAMIHRLAKPAARPALPEMPAGDPEAAARAALFTPGTRRLHQLSRDQQRPIEVRLYNLRRVHNRSEAEISHLIDLHPADLDALAATHGQP